jgi:hypothetical protein
MIKSSKQFVQEPNVLFGVYGCLYYFDQVGRERNDIHGHFGMPEVR